MTLAAAADAAFALVDEAIDAGRIPGAVLGLVTRDGDRAIRFGGHAALVPERAALAEDALFDLASLTKVILTTTEVLRLVEQGRIDLSDPLALHLPDLRQYQPEHWVRQVTVRQLLSHRSGLPAVEPLYTWGSDPETLKALVLQKDWAAGARDLFRRQLRAAGHPGRAAAGQAAARPAAAGRLRRQPRPGPRRGHRALHLARPGDARRGA